MFVIPARAIGLIPVSNASSVSTIGGHVKAQAAPVLDFSYFFAMWLAPPEADAVRFCFDERLRADAAAVVGKLLRIGLAVKLVSGERSEPVEPIASVIGIKNWRAG